MSAERNESRVRRRKRENIVTQGRVRLASAQRTKGIMELDSRHLDFALQRHEPNVIAVRARTWRTSCSLTDRSSSFILEAM